MRASLLKMCLLCCFLVSVFAGCGVGNREDSGTVLRIGLGGEPRDLDPHTTTGALERSVFGSLLEGLMAPHPTDETIPYSGVAAQWTMSEDGKTWHFHLREDARWSNEDLVTASDFVYSWKRVLNPELGCYFSYLLYGIKGAEAYHLGEITDFDQVGIVAESDHTLRIELEKPLANFLLKLLHPVFLPVHPPTIEAHGGPAVFASGWTAAGSFVGNGPFELVQWNPDSMIRVEKNPHYWDIESVGLDAIEFYPMSDANTQLRAFETGQLHVTSSVPENMQTYYEEQFPERIRFDPNYHSVFYRINDTRPPLTDVRVRKALSLAIDRRQLVEQLLHGYHQVAHAFVPDGVNGYASPPGVEYDPDTARQLIAEAGYPGGTGFPGFVLLFYNDVSVRKLAEAVQAMWERELGISVTPTNNEWKTYLTVTEQMDYDVCADGWFGDTTPYSLLQTMTSGNPNNMTGFADSEYDRLVEEGTHVLDKARRHTIMQAAEARLMDYHSIIPLYWSSQIYLIDPRVRNWHPKIGIRQYKVVTLED